MGHNWWVQVLPATHQIARSDSIQLDSEHVQNSATGKKLPNFSRVELSRVVYMGVTTASTQLNSTQLWRKIYIISIFVVSNK